MLKESPPISVQIAALRLLIGFLGEKPQFAWWDTNFLSPIGQQYMAINFPRTALSAGIHSVTDAARRIHDERIGKGGVYHLFRLPSALEEDVHHAILKGHAQLVLTQIRTKETALDEMKKLATEEDLTGSGPVLIGQIPELEKPETLGRLAAIYQRAFAIGLPSFPYFSHE